MLRWLCLVIVLLVAPAASAQPTVVVPSLPYTQTWTWDDPSLASGKPDAYRIMLDSEPPILVPATQATPCGGCATVDLVITTARSHTVSIVALKTGFPDTSPLVVTFPIVVGIGPVTPTAMRLTNVLVPPAISFTDAEGAVWTVGAQMSPPPCPGVPVTQCRSIRRNNVHVGIGFELLYLRDVVYAHGWEGDWWRWNGSAFPVPSLGPTRPR